MKHLTGKFVFFSVVGIWILAVLPFFVPAINSIEPRILGLPFVVVWEFIVLALHILLVVVSALYVWDTFDKEEWAVK